jgi:ankyrin repeat protein
VDLDQLRKQAKELVRAARAGEPEALERLGGREPILARAQLVVAREHGYASWPRLVAAAEAGADAFVLAATDRRRGRADAMLEARPDIADDPWAGLVLGRGWDGDPNAPGGPRGWAPLHYACHSVYAPSGLVRELLERGADPNATYTNEYGPMSALYGAAGVVHDPEMTRLLLEHGADPDDNESVYHSTEAASTDCLRLLLEHGAATRGTNALAHALDDDREEHVRLLLEAGADANEGFLIAHAVRRGRGPALVRLLAEHGADVDRPGGETWRGEVPLRTPYQHAVIRNRADLVAELERLGASTEVSEGDQAAAAVVRGERAELPASLDVDQQEVLILAAVHGGQAEAVVDAVGVGFAGVVGGSPEGTILHHAAWFGEADVVRLLLARGADPHAASGASFETPLAWAVHASQTTGADRRGVGELLLAAGAEIEPRFLDAAEGPLLELLQEAASRPGS